MIQVIQNQQLSLVDPRFIVFFFYFEKRFLLTQHVSSLYNNINPLSNFTVVV